MTSKLVNVALGLVPIVLAPSAFAAEGQPPASPEVTAAMQPYLDSYKLVKLRVVVAVVACGALVAGASYLVNGLILDVIEINLSHFSRYIAPLIEELLKGLVIVVLVRTHRIGFLVDAAIFGFAVGTGFAVVENVYFLGLIPDAGLGTWIVRGFGTAIMHGGATAIFAVLGLSMQERAQRASLQALADNGKFSVIAAEQRDGVARGKAQHARRMMRSGIGERDLGALGQRQRTMEARRHSGHDWKVPRMC